LIKLNWYLSYKAQKTVQNVVSESVTTFFPQKGSINMQAIHQWHVWTTVSKLLTAVTTVNFIAILDFP